jgi:hypothetical protein
MSDNIKTLIGEIERAIAEIDTVLADQADESPTVVNPFHEKGENRNASLPQPPGSDAPCGDLSPPGRQRDKHEGSA